MLAVSLSGRCSDGVGRDQGYVVHWAKGVGFSPAICGARPGRLSGIGFEYIAGEIRAVTCRGCLAQERRNIIEAHRGRDCAWCGGEIGRNFGPLYANRALEVFCSKSHRASSNRARDAFLASESSASCTRGRR